MLDFVRLG